MKDMFAEVYIPFLLANGFYLDNCSHQFCREGTCYSLSSDKGEGHFWYYTYPNLFSIYIEDFILYEDVTAHYEQPDYISICCYDSAAGEELDSHKPLARNCFKGHQNGRTLFSSVYRKDTPIRSTGIVIVPEYFEAYLRSRYPNEFGEVCSALSNVGGTAYIPEIVLLLRQIRCYRGAGLSAKLYFEGKVTEALSLIVERGNQSGAAASMGLSIEDAASLASVIAYIEERFASDIQLKQLTRIACMGVTKLKTSFKLAYRCTITEYIQQKRMHHAEQLLFSTELNIRQIAQEVGYKNPSRLCELFRKSTGFTPYQYRRQMRPSVTG